MMLLFIAVQSGSNSDSYSVERELPLWQTESYVQLEGHTEQQTVCMYTIYRTLPKLNDHI